MMSTWISIALAAGLFAGMILCHDLGRRLARHRPSGRTEMAGGGAIEAAVFALLGLLLSFAFGGALTRLDARRSNVVQEANAISTVYQRVDVLPAARRPALRQLLREYVEARRAVYDQPDLAAARRHHARAVEIQGRIWEAAVAALDDQSSQMLVLPALNAMTDAATTRSITSATRVPVPVFALLMIVALVSALVSGARTARAHSRAWFYVVAYAAVIAMTTYVILDLEYPRSGLVQIGAADDVLRMLQDAIRE